MACLLLVIGLLVGASTPVHAAVALLATLLLLRQETRLLLAPLYGGGLLVAEELAVRSIELTGVEHLGAGVVSARLAATLSVATLGGCAAVLAALAVTVAPGRSVLFTAVGVIAVLAMFGAITRVARGRHPTPDSIVAARESEP